MPRSLTLTVVTLLAALTATTASAADERLVLEPYPGKPAWTEVTTVQRGDKFLRELIPGDQKIETYRDILTAQSFPELRGADPAPYLRGLFGIIGKHCTGVRVNGPTERLEGGVKVAYAQIYCGRQTGKDFGVNMAFKAIQGQSALYVVQREARVPPTETGGVQSFDKGQMDQMRTMLAAAGVTNSYLAQSVYLCGAGSRDAKCRR